MPSTGSLRTSGSKDYARLLPRRPTGFFADHLKRYSKSRRQAPIYWPLSTAKGSYTLWTTTIVSPTRLYTPVWPRTLSTQSLRPSALRSASCAISATTATVWRSCWTWKRKRQTSAPRSSASSSSSPGTPTSTMASLSPPAPYGSFSHAQMAEYQSLLGKAGKGRL